MDRVEVQVSHLLKEVWGWWASSDCHTDRFGQFFGLLGVAEESVDGWRCVEMGNVLFLEHFPDLRIIDLA
jgi:hypothetical protein